MCVAHLSRVLPSAQMESVPRIFGVTMMLAFQIVLFSVFAHLFFAGVTRETCDGPPTREWCSTYALNCFDFFGNIGNAMDQMFQLLTAANFPDIMMPAYNCYPWAAVFFIVRPRACRGNSARLHCVQVFVLIGYYFVMNLILLVSYNVFSEKTKEKTIQTIGKQMAALDAAFNLLTQQVWLCCAVTSSCAGCGITLAARRTTWTARAT